MKLPICEKFISIQGEGLRTGRPSLFVRVSGCNLRCVFRNKDGDVGSKCDTPYASFEPEKNKFKEKDILNDLMNHPEIEDVVVTGGEPMLYTNALVDLFQSMRKINSKIVITIETNGTITPPDELIRLVDLWSVSPKLKNSEPCILDGVSAKLCEFHQRCRINFEALNKIVESGHDCQLKFVYSDESCLNEIIDIRDMIQDRVSFNVDDYMMLMPEGITREEIIKKSPDVIKVCIQYGWAFSTRLHILVWDNKRGF